MSHVITHHGVKVRLKSGHRSLTEHQRGRLDQGIADRDIRQSAQCIVFFPGNRSTPVQRCEDRKLSTSASRRYAGQRRRGELCKKKSNGQFSTRCGR